MSKKISYKGQLPVGEQDKIRLRTLNGKKGYKITKFEIIGSTPGVANGEYIAKIYNTNQTGSITNTINFTESDLLATCFAGSSTNNTQIPPLQVTIFDNKRFNQDIFIYIVDVSGGTVPCNYYIELDVIDLNDLQATQLTLENIRDITAPTGNV